MTTQTAPAAPAHSDPIDSIGRDAPREEERRIAGSATPKPSLRLPVLCGSAFALCLVWACWPLEATITTPTVKPLAAAAPVQPIPKRPLDLAAFRAPLWVVPPPPPPPPAPPAPAPPLKLQLIAIISADAAHLKSAALLYDPDQDKLFTVHEGETLQGRAIEKITQARVHIRDGGGERILALRPEGGGQ